MVACIVYTWVLLSSFSAFHSHLGPVTLIKSERKWLLMSKTFLGNNKLLIFVINSLYFTFTYLVWLEGRL